MVACIEQYFKYDKKLPFIFKILSIEQPLSLQAHPDKKLAQQLHKQDPQNYPDANHKPELAIALTDLEVLCDFRPSKEILNFLKVLSPFRSIVGDKNYDCFAKAMHSHDEQEKRSALAECFKSLMISNKEIIINKTKELITNVEFAASIDKDLLRLIVKLERLYPGDPGIFAPFFLNYLKLQPGQAVFLEANKLHAYIKGELVECMACSDNVVRAGLTTKFRDVNTLLNMLNYECVKNANDLLLEGFKHSNDSMIISYAPSEEFKVDKIVITEKNVPLGEYILSSLPSGSFIIVLQGRATANNFFDVNLQHKLTLGSSAFIPPKIRLKLHNIHGNLLLYRAYC